MQSTMFHFFVLTSDIQSINIKGIVHMHVVLANEARFTPDLLIQWALK